MDIAKSTSLGRLFTVEQFDAQPDAVKTAHRNKGFTCPDKACGVPAGFRPRGRDGSSPRFFATHTRDCQLRSTAWAELEAPGTTTVAAIDNTGAHITLIPDGLDLGSTAAAPVAASAADPTTPGPARRHDASVGTVRRENTTQGMRRFLGRLRAHPGSADTDTPITLPGADAPATLREAVHRPEQITAADIGQPRLIWGTIHQGSTNQAGTTVFLRSGPYDAASFYLRVPGDLAASALDALGWSSWGHATGAHFIAWGQLNRDKNTAPYLSISTLNQFYLRH